MLETQWARMKKLLARARARVRARARITIVSGAGTHTGTGTKRPIKVLDSFLKTYGLLD